MNTQEKFLHFINSQKLFKKEDPILLAVSGGIDSMVMCDLLLKCGYQVGLAHVNFELRGAESDEDQVFIQSFSRQKNIPFFTVNFPAKSLAKEQKRSIQELARDLRYEWLEEIRQKNNYKFLATAHHLNDSIETILYNWTKGTSIKGLLGIPTRNGSIVRPLLGIKREEIEEYAIEHKIKFREDSSNLEGKYSRNKIRHHVTPILKEINPNFEQTVAANLHPLSDVHNIYQWAISSFLKKELKENGEKLELKIKNLDFFPAPETLLYEWLKPYGFNGQQAAQIWSRRKGQAGAMFFSSSYQLLIDREKFILEERIEKNILQKTYTLEKDVAFLQMEDAKIQISFFSDRPKSFKSDVNVAFLDADHLVYPLIVRHWKKGDSFYPLGMNGHSKKLQDLFTDLKLPRTQKEKVWIIENGDGKICWVVGFRIDDRFKITSNTENVMKLKYEP